MDTTAVGGGTRHQRSSASKARGRPLTHHRAASPAGGARRKRRSKSPVAPA